MDINTLRAYIVLHKLSLEQDLDDAINGVEPGEGSHFESDEYYLGAMDTCTHLLEYIDER